MKQIKVSHSSGSYQIYVGAGILGEALADVFEKNKFDRIFLVSDSNVFPLYGERVKSALGKVGITLSGEYVFPAGETSKTLETVACMYNAFREASLTRKSLVIALGGGVCGDMAGYAAATYLRGMAVLQTPTTLLSQVDSSIGGKTGVDLPCGKNLVGAFHQPTAVIADSDFLETLPREYMNDGMGEVIKYGCIADKELFYGIANSTLRLDEIIFRCMKIKAEVVEADEFEGGLRMILNYGHTIGHGVEKLGGYTRFSHGESVGIGMLYAARIGVGEGYSCELEGEIRRALGVCRLPMDMDYSPEELISVVMADKKRVGDDISVVLIEDIGKAVIKKLPIQKIKELIS